MLLLLFVKLCIRPDATNLRVSAYKNFCSELKYAFSGALIHYPTALFRKWNVSRYHHMVVVYQVETAERVPFAEDSLRDTVENSRKEPAGEP